jgi:hypothetical protein
MLAPLVLFGSLLSCGGDVRGGATPPADASADAASSDGSTPNHACVEAGAPYGATSLPLGIYTQCSGTVVDGNTTFGGDATGTLTLTESGSVLSVALGDGLFSIAPGTLTFDAVSNGAAVVAPGQSYGLLVGQSPLMGPCSSATAAEGALALDGNSLVISIVGQGCGNQVGSFITCPLPAQPTGMLEGAEICDEVDAGPQAFPRNAFAQCTDSIPEYGQGSVSASESQGLWTAVLQGVSGISTLNPGLIVSPIDSSAAFITPGQLLTTKALGWPGCSGPPPNSSGGIIDPGPVTRTTTTNSGWLVVDGSTLFVFLGGTDECGAAVVRSFNCAAQ